MDRAADPAPTCWTRCNRVTPAGPEFSAKALWLTRAMDWQGIVKTRISLGKGDYRLQVDGRGAHLLIDGDVKAVETEVEPKLLFESLAKAVIPPKIETTVRSALDA